MRLGIISDTHGALSAAVHDVFSQVDRIVHAGDIGGDDIIIELETIAPVTAVYGNTDGLDLRNRLPRVATFELNGLYFTITHGDQFGRPTPPVLCNRFPEADVLIYGHTHEPLLELVDKTKTVMNPGSASHPRGDGPPSVGIMETEAGLPPRARLVPLIRS
jgi:hypothetical protein